MNCNHDNEIHIHFDYVSAEPETDSPSYVMYDGSEIFNCEQCKMVTPHGVTKQNLLEYGDSYEA